MKIKVTTGDDEVITLDYPPIPKTIAGIIKLAKKDLMLVRDDDHYVINMSTFHMPRYRVTGDTASRCAVCFAGAVMAKSIHLPYTSMSAFHYRPLDSQPNLKNKVLRRDSWNFIFCFLDDIRLGNLHEVSSIVRNIPHLKQEWQFNTEGYRKLRNNFSQYSSHNPEPFFDWLDDLIEELERQRKGKLS